MAVINIVVPPLRRKVFTGGIYCIFKYAAGLRSLGHEVNVVPLLPSPRPQWIDTDFGSMPDGNVLARMHDVVVGCRDVMFTSLKRVAGNRQARRHAQHAVQQLTTALGLARPKMFSPLVQRALQLAHVKQHIKPADATIATSYESALAVQWYGAGRKYYFAQHYEPYFAGETADPSLAEQEALLSYKLGLRMIANSTWLKCMLESEAHVPDVALCANAIDHTVFTGQPQLPEDRKEVRVISYGGRSARWKGFEEMARAVRIARERAPAYSFRWLVYGESLLPPDNNIAAYEPLGFLQPPALAAAYRSADILLSASWYESFPLFPLEAMACGLPAITTQAGTEEYAIADETAAIVEARNPESIANALLRLVSEPRYRHGLAVRGQQKSREFTWDAAVKRMEQLVLG